MLPKFKTYLCASLLLSEKVSTPLLVFCTLAGNHDLVVLTGARTPCDFFKPSEGFLVLLESIEIFLFVA